MGKPTAKTQNNPPIETRALSISQFCEAYGISRATFYNLKKSGNAPAILHIGRRSLITISASEAWVAAMTEASATRNITSINYKTSVNQPSMTSYLHGGEG